jgi:hypothetical protein
MIYEPNDDSLRKLLTNLAPLANVLAKGLAALLTDGLAPLLAAAATFLQDLRVHCPEAFDAGGNLRPDWQEIVQAKLDSMQPPPRLHAELATRRIEVHLN